MRGGKGEFTSGEGQEYENDCKTRKARHWKGLASSEKKGVFDRKEDGNGCLQKGVLGLISMEKQNTQRLQKVWYANTKKDIVHSRKSYR